MSKPKIYITRNTYQVGNYFFDKRDKKRIGTLEARRRQRISESRKQTLKAKKERQETEEKKIGFHYRLMVSTELYCGNQTTVLESEEIFDSEQDARNSIERLASGIIDANASHCGKKPKSVNYRIEQIV